MTNGRKTRMMQTPTATHRPRPESQREAPTMIDRERLLATDHEARLHAEAQLRRLAADAAPGADDRRSTISRARRSLGRWLLGSGQRLDASPDPCGPAEPKPA
jgi:hypothetical protein